MWTLAAAVVCLLHLVNWTTRTEATLGAVQLLSLCHLVALHTVSLAHTLFSLVFFFLERMSGSPSRIADIGGSGDGMGPKGE